MTEATEQQEKKPDPKPKRKLIPPVFMLSAAAVVSIYTYLQGYELGRWLVILFSVMVLFLILGLCFEWMLEYFEKVNTERAEAERIRILEEAAQRAAEEEASEATENFEDTDAPEEMEEAVS
ncbi:MAG: hypothetical protein IJR58_02260 [Lachnospiraceae bacterium]|nr:hypothetical protein [Lachnospiraceae bacterium]